MAVSTATRPATKTGSKSASRNGVRTFTPAFGAIKTINGELRMVGEYEMTWQPSVTEAQAMITQLQQYIARIGGSGHGGTAAAKRTAGRG
jgi:hypothetical protein